MHLRGFYLYGVFLSTFIMPFLGPTHVAAQPMSHADHDRSPAVCANYCAKSNDSPTQEQGILNEREKQDQEPVPPENTYYYLQFIRPAVPKSIKPTSCIDTNPLRPPDKAAWLVRFRF